jgi:hypothetical protein
MSAEHPTATTASRATPKISLRIFASIDAYSSEHGLALFQPRFVRVAKRLRTRVRDANRFMARGTGGPRIRPGRAGRPGGQVANPKLSQKAHNFEQLQVGAA